MPRMCYTRLDHELIDMGIENVRQDSQDIFRRHDEQPASISHHKTERWEQEDDGVSSARDSADTSGFSIDKMFGPMQLQSYIFQVALLETKEIPAMAQ